MPSQYRRLHGSSAHGTTTEDSTSRVQSEQQQQLQVRVKGLFTHLKENFQTLQGSPSELYVNFLLKFFTSYSYFAVSQILVIYLHNEFGATDMEAGTMYGMWGLCTTFWGLVASWMNDNLGVRNSLLLGFIISIFASFFMAVTSSMMMMYLLLFLLLPMGTAMGIPMLTVGIKRYTTTTNRGFAFGLYYSVMNIAAFVSGPVVDGFNIGLKDGVKMFGVHWSGNRLVIFSTFITNLCSFIVTYYYLREIRMNEGYVTNTTSTTTSSTAAAVTATTQQNPLFVIEDVEDEKDDTNNGEHLSYIRNLTASPPHSSSLTIDAEAASQSMTTDEVQQQQQRPAVEVYEPEQKSLWQTASELIYSATFWRFVVLTLFLINLKAIFRHLDATLPTYLIRCFGPRYPKGIIYSINPFMIMWLTPIVAAVTTNYKHYDMIKYGGYLTGISPFFLAMDTSTTAVVMFVVFLSLGEAIWSPRTYDYTMSVAPEGREASFSALAAAPLFAAKVPVGLLSGYLIAKYIPEDSEHPDGQTLWLIIGLLTISSPICVTIFERCIREPSSSSSHEEVISNNNQIEMIEKKDSEHHHELLSSADLDDGINDVVDVTGTPSVDSLSDCDNNNIPTNTQIIDKQRNIQNNERINSLNRYDRKVAEGDIAYRLQQGCHHSHSSSHSSNSSSNGSSSDDTGGVDIQV